MAKRPTALLWDDLVSRGQAQLSDQTAVAVCVRETGSVSRETL
jgi:hypothetical protein